MTGNRTICLSNGIPGYSSLSLINEFESNYDLVFYQYDHCSKVSSIKQLMCPKRKLVLCYCLSTTTAASSDFVCNLDRDVLASTKIMVALLGVILNTMVISVYLRRRSIQKKVGNTLLVIQALVDLFNVVFYAIPDGVLILVLPDLYDPMIGENLMAGKITIYALFFLSLNTSLNLFTFIAIERYLCISRPRWHRNNLTKTWVKKRLVIVIIASAAVTPLQTLSAVVNITALSYVWLVLGLIGIVNVSLLFAISFIKARACLQRKNNNTYRKEKRHGNIEGKGSQENVKESFIDKKMFKLTKVFLIMYAVFLLALLPMLVNTIIWLMKGDLSIMSSTVVGLLFTITAMINPVLTLSLREDYKIFSAKRVIIHRFNRAIQNTL